MSWEGFQYFICENAHLHRGEDYSGGGWNLNLYSEFTCPICGTKAKWSRTISDTNGDGEEIEFETLSPEVTETCDKCGVTHIKHHRTVKVPD